LLKTYKRERVEVYGVCRIRTHPVPRRVCEAVWRHPKAELSQWAEMSELRSQSPRAAAQTNIALLPHLFAAEWVVCDS